MHSRAEAEDGHMTRHAVLNYYYLTEPLDILSHVEILRGSTEKCRFTPLLESEATSSYRKLNSPTGM